MTPHKQKNLHKPEEGIYGDCWRTCIACLLDMEPEAVPHFMEMEDGDAQTTAWLRERDMDIVRIPFPNDLPQLFEYMDAMNSGVYWILGGTSRTGVGHVVICEGGKIIHDPSRKDSGIVGPMEDGIYWAHFITVRGNS